MAASNSGRLAAIIQRYGEVADAVNRREMKRFTDGARQGWAPEPPEEWEPHGEGYTDEGAFALCVYDLAFGGSPERQGQLCEAEKLDQVLLHPPLDAFVDVIDKPLSNPVPKEDA